MKVKIQIKIQILALHGDDGENFDGKCLISKSKLWLIKYHTEWESDRSYLSWNLLPGVSHSFPHTNSTIHSPILFTTPKTVCIQYDPNVKANMDTKKTWRNTRRMSDDLAPNKSYWVISYSELDLVWVCRHLTRSIWKSNDARVYTVARPKAHTERERETDTRTFILYRINIVTIHVTWCWKRHETISLLNRKYMHMRTTNVFPLMTKFCGHWNSSVKCNKHLIRMTLIWINKFCVRNNIFCSIFENSFES